MFLICIIVSLFSSIFAQSGCLDEGIGPCIGSFCETGFTCVTNINTCCADSNIVLPTTAVTTASASTSCVDKLNPSSGTSDCPSRASYCNNTVYYNLMTQQCPFTCGRCSSAPASSGSTSTTCVDRLNPITGVSDCPARAALCNNAIYYSVMTQQCPFTCGRCSSAPASSANSSTTCVDKVNPISGVSDCPTLAFLCNNNLYSSLMTEQCPATCERCSENSATNSAASCVDKVNPLSGVSDCPALAYLCDSNLYYSLMTEQCPATCGRCSGANAVTTVTTGNSATSATSDSITESTTSASITTSRPFIQRLACPTGWHYLSSTLSCYKVGDGAKTFSLAEADCQAEGANIASVHSPEENAFVRSTLVTSETSPPEQWLGMTDFDDNFVHLDGTPVDFLNFNTGEPNRDTENCMTMLAGPDGPWNDVPCTAEFIFVCKKQAVPL